MSDAAPKPPLWMRLIPKRTMSRVLGALGLLPLPGFLLAYGGNGILQAHKARPQLCWISSLCLTAPTLLVVQVV